MCLTRDQFRARTLARVGGSCAAPGCSAPAVDPHHIMERALWLRSDPCPEGYLAANGAGLCERHHIHAEKNLIPPLALRRWLALPTVLPRQLDPARLWDKWGAEIPRSPHNKYPRTPYLPFSPNVGGADDATADPADFLNKPLVVTVKMDGANVCLSSEKATGRNGDTAAGPQFDPLKALHAGLRAHLPEGVVFYGEWLFARHSIAYTGATALPSYLMLFAAMDLDTQLLWGWDELRDFAGGVGLECVPEVARVEADADWKLQAALYETFEKATDAGHEGVVVKSVYPVHHGQFAANAAKMVREGHNQCGDDWKTRPIVRNQLRS